MVKEWEVQSNSYTDDGYVWGVAYCWDTDVWGILKGYCVYAVCELVVAFGTTAHVGAHCAHTSDLSW